MKIVDTILEKSLDISNDTAIVMGTIIGDVHVRQGAMLDLRGTVTGNITVYGGAAVQLRGKVTGDITNLGGAINISGIVEGVVNFEAGLTTYSEGASIAGRPIPTSALNSIS